VREEVFLPFPAPTRAEVPMASHVRGTWLAAVVRTMRAGPHFEAYARELDPSVRGTVLGAIAGDWLPIDVLMDHYAACDRLALPAEEIAEIGRGALQFAQGSILALTARVATQTVTTPWRVLGQLQRFWDRFILGGGVCVYRVGPKEARVELVQFPGCRFRHFRVGARSVTQATFDFLCQKAFTSELPKLGSPTSLSVRIAWV